MEMYTLGSLVFGVPSLSAAEAVRVARYRWSAKDVVGGSPEFQWLGPGEDKLTLSGASLVAAAGTDDAVAALRNAASAGEALPLADGGGRVLGKWALQSVEERRRGIRADGIPAHIEWRLELTLVEPPGTSANRSRARQLFAADRAEVAAAVEKIELLRAPVKEELAENVRAVDRARELVREGLSWREALEEQVGGRAAQIEAALDSAGLKGLPRRLWGPEQLLALQPALPGEGVIREIRQAAEV